MSAASAMIFFMMEFPFIYSSRGRVQIGDVTNQWGKATFFSYPIVLRGSTVFVNVGDRGNPALSSRLFSGVLSARMRVLRPSGHFKVVNCPVLRSFLSLTQEN